MNLLEEAKKYVLGYSLPESLERLKGTYFNGLCTAPFNKLTPLIMAESLYYSIQPEPSAVKDESLLPLGSSKIRGLPHLPTSIQWPKNFHFLAQFNLKELSTLDIYNVIPTSGVLYIFYDANDRAKVFVYDGDAQDLKIRPYPSQGNRTGEYYSSKFRSASAAVTFNPGYTFCINDFSEVGQHIPIELTNKVETILGCPHVLDDSGCRVFGRPTYYQGEDFSEHMKNPESYLPFNNLMLFQDEFGEGMIHVWIDKASLMKGSFEEAFVTFSGT